jgi:hypothetical protein
VPPLLNAFKAKNLTLMHQGLCEKIVNMPKDELDLVTSVDVQVHNVIAAADTMEWDFNLKDTWLTRSRWAMMIRQYLDRDELAAWLNRTATMVGWGGRGISLLRTKQVMPRGGRDLGNKETRRWGSCMISVSYKAVPAPQITLHSRTSYLGYLAGMDLSVAWMCGRYLAEMTNHSVEDMRFVWLNEAMQYHHFKSLAYFLNHRDEELREYYRRLLMDDEETLTKKQRKHVNSSPALMYSRKWVQKSIAEDRAGHTLGDINYNTYRRIKRRFHTEVFGYEYAQQFEGWSYHTKGDQAGKQKEFFKAYQPLPDCPVQSLDFAPLGLPAFASVAGIDYNGPVIDSLDEEDEE